MMRVHLCDEHTQMLELQQSVHGKSSFSIPYSIVVVREHVLSRTFRSSKRFLRPFAQANAFLVGARSWRALLPALVASPWLRVRKVCRHYPLLLDSPLR